MTTLRFSTLTGLILALILPIFALAPLFYPGYIQTHSGLVPLWNLADWRANPVNLTWTPHIAILFNPLRSDGLLPYYLAGLLPLAPAAAVKVMLGLAWLLGSLGMVVWLRPWLGRPGALAAALVYTYLPYRLAVVYVRGAWGEALFWGLLPWALGVAIVLVVSPNSGEPEYIVRFNKNKSYQFCKSCLKIAILAFMWLLLGLSQLGLTLWAWILVMLLLLVTNRRRAFGPGLAAGVGVAAALAFYLALFPFPSSSPVSFTDHFLYPFQLFSAYWGFGVSQPGWNDGLSFQLGLAGFGLTLVTLAAWRQKTAEILNTSTPFVTRHLSFFLVTALVLTLSQFSLTTFFWQLPVWPGYTLSNTLTYPWQLLGLVGVCLAVLSGAAFRLDNHLTRLPLFGSVVLLVILSSYPYLLPQFIHLDPYFQPKPQAELGQAQVTVLTHDFTVVINGHTAGFEAGQTAIPLAAHGPLRADETRLVNVVWHPLQPLPQNLKVFVHLIDPTGQVIAQYDGQPRSGDYPTSRWIPGEFIKDSYPILFPANVPPGPYRIYLGLYDEATLARLSVPGDAEGRVSWHVE